MLKKISMILMMMFLMPAICQAAMIEIGFAGLVDYVDDQYNLLENGVQEGASISGFYIYDSETPDSSLQFDQGTYQHTSASCGISLTIDSLAFQTDPINEELGMVIWNKSNYDMYSVLSRNNLPLYDDINVDTVGLSLHDLSGAAISSIDLPLTPPDLSVWQHKDISVGGGQYPLPPDGSKTLFYIKGHVTSVWLIPEPTTLLLFGFGALILRKRKRN